MEVLLIKNEQKCLPGFKKIWWKKPSRTLRDGIKFTFQNNTLNLFNTFYFFAEQTANSTPHVHTFLQKDPIRMAADPLVFCWIVFDDLPAQCTPWCEGVTFTDSWLAMFFFFFSRCQQVAGNFQKFYNRKRNKPLKWEEQPLSLNDFNFSSLEELKET